MDELFLNTFKTIQSAFAIEPIILPAELKETKFPMRLLEIQCYNWKAAKIRKIYAMRMKIKMPFLDIMGMAIYPEPDFDLPIFCFDLSCAKKKIVTYINVIPLLDNDAYQKKYLDPFILVRGKYDIFPPHKMPEWMLQYRADHTIYSMPDRGIVDKIKACALDYLAVYLELIKKVQRIEDDTYRAQIADAQKTYIKNLLTKDATQKMLAKLIGKQKTSRIFNEVLV